MPTLRYRVNLALLSVSHLFVCFGFAEDGVSIPCSYTSFLAPLSSSKLYNEVRSCRERDKDPECHFETPYVVRLHNFHQLADPKPCFTFVHPTTGERPRCECNAHPLRFHTQEESRSFLQMTALPCRNPLTAAFPSLRYEQQQISVFAFLCFL